MAQRAYNVFTSFYMVVIILGIVGNILIIISILRYVRHVFKFVGIYMMLIIAILRYHAALHPLKHNISRRKLTVICSLGYILGLILQCGTSVPRCFLQKTVVDYMNKYVYAYVILVLYVAPTLFMAVLYYKVYRALEKQNKYLKNLTPGKESFSTSFKILRIIDSEAILLDNIWLTYFAFILRAAGTASVNPLIYGIMDQTLQPFVKCCSKKKDVQKIPRV
ncbi:uncharacterized protein LOC114522975 [Dendronephthya gigantea]|uniref:uncharacterized protein LOC114522975 n=1 Tax=Dendronephthya gigantea TaxID=151771 RepID=UPI00106C8D90|nr:uncharacterized protein LOC114522975 [Dendronephthya gigantea]